MASLLECSNVHAYYGALHALKPSLEVRGRPALPFWSNGSGKSTLFNCILGSLAARSGTIEFAGHPVVSGAVHRNVQLGIGSCRRTETCSRI
jgi:ABC-type branched-subunit amino acid transport system ATPase component